MKFNIDRPRALITLGAGLTGLAQSNPGESHRGAAA